MPISDVWTELSPIVDLIQPAILIILTVVGWGIKNINANIRHLDDKVDSLRVTLRDELRAELKEYQRRETCRIHREQITAQLEKMRCACENCKKNPPT